MPQPRKRFHSQECSVSKMPLNGRVRILGTVIGIDDKNLILDDGTGQVELLFEKKEQISYISEGDLVRVIADIVNPNYCIGRCIQLMDGFDVELNKRAKNILGRNK